MRKIAGAVSAGALVSVAVLTFSKAVFVTQAVGMGVDTGVNDESAAAKIAHRFPPNAEPFREFIAPVNTAELAARPSVAAVACGSVFSPALTSECLAASHKPAKPAALAVVERPAAEPRPAPVAAPTAVAPVVAAPVVAPVAASAKAALAPTPAAVAAPVEPVRTRVTALGTPASAVPVAAAAPVRAPVTVAPPSCAQTLPTANARVERVLARIKDARTRAGSDACAAYRSDFFEIVQAREVAALCKSGADRERDLRRIDGAVEDINGAIAQTCGT
jgi:hypothetical protein